MISPTGSCMSDCQFSIIALKTDISMLRPLFRSHATLQLWLIDCRIYIALTLWCLILPGQELSLFPLALLQLSLMYLPSKIKSPKKDSNFSLIIYFIFIGAIFPHDVPFSYYLNTFVRWRLSLLAFAHFAFLPLTRIVPWSIKVDIVVYLSPSIDTAKNTALFSIYYASAYGPWDALIFVYVLLAPHQLACFTCATKVPGVSILIIDILIRSILPPPPRLYTSQANSHA